MAITFKAKAEAKADIFWPETKAKASHHPRPNITACSINFVLYFEYFELTASTDATAH